MSTTEKTTLGPRDPAPPPGPVFTDRDFWHGADLDLDAYLDRVGLPADLPPTLDTLTAVHRAHLAAIPFENLQLLLDRPVPLDVPSLTDKMVHHHRGGYCYEQNLLLAAVLDRLGFTLTAFSARVLMGGDGRPRPSTHALSRVDLEGASWLVDVGFGGGGPLEPFPFVDGHQTSQDGWDLRLDRKDPGGAGPEREVRELRVEEVGKVLHEVFGIHLDQREREVVEERVRGFLGM
ncbi:arylamine N-acetyltransferase [Nocardiopsis sp. JB363]|uniref:arylamine N-acetyltransferase family protein n=1 Tax=Nocardiopsis sp. JB363 TaxID=1434837 RepID=UPI00097A9FD3|nr:arylamine N-acetyltransferase [Nocardiopsis sp. JB363]SIO91204.1 hypothetical protein BQ8420_30560 [Nocardiopsis sp. JB363]